MEHSIRDLLFDAAGRAARYKEAVRHRDVYPGDEALRGLDQFGATLPEHPVGAAEVLALLDHAGSPATVASTGGRYFGFVTGGTEPAAIAASMLAGAWDQNIALPVMSPVAARLDDIAARWVVELLGLPPTALATFCSGASLANLTAILTARDALLWRAGWDVAGDGLAGAPPIRVVATEEAHISMTRALRFAGLGVNTVQWLPTDAYGRVDRDAFRDVALDANTLVLLQAGNVNTGHSDVFADVIPPVHQAGGWVHVDGAFGLWCAASPALAPSVAGVELADSWATDAHKWLNAPYDAGIVICARPEDQRRAMSMDAAYVATTEDRALMQLGMQMSQRPRGIETWAVIASRGRSGIADGISACHQHACTLGSLLADGGATLLVPVASNQVLVSFGVDATTDAVVEAVQSDGTCWAGGTTWKQHRALRLSVCDTSTTDADVRRVAAAILRCFGRISEAMSNGT